MANNLVVQLLLKTGTFSNDLKTAKGQIQNFQKGCNTASKSLTSFGQGLGINVGTLTKFGGAIGVAMAAGKEFKAILESSQTTSDAFHNSIAGAKGIIEQFNTAIATADFTVFNDGLWGAYENAKKVAEAIDQLNNTKLAYDYMSKSNQTKFKEAYNVWKNPKSTKEMKEAAVQQMKEAVEAQWEYARNYNAQAYKGYVAQVVKEAGEFNLPIWNVTKEQFRKAMEIDLSPDPQKERDRIDKQYNEYLKRLNEYKNKNRNYFNRDTEPEYNNITAVNALKKEYADVIAIRAMLKLMKDDELKGLADILTGMETVIQEAHDLEKQYNRVASGEEKIDEAERKQIERKKEELKLAKGSLADLQKRIVETTQLRDAEAFGTEAWKKHNSEINILNALLKEAREKIKEYNGEIETQIPEGSLTYIKKQISAAEELRDRLVWGTEEWKKQDELVKDLNKQLDIMTGKTAEVAKKNAENAKTNADKEVKKLQDITKAYQSAQEDRMNIEKNLPLDSLAISSNTLGNITSIVSSIQSLKTAWENAETSGEKFMIVLQSFEAGLNTVLTVVDTINSVKGVIDSLANAKRIEEETKLAAAQQAQVAIMAEEAALSATLTAAQVAETGAVNGLAAAYTELAAAKTMVAAVAASGVAGVAIGAAEVAAMTAAIVSAGLTVGAFANGGIVGGNSFSGDKLTANVNSGEMILNRAQQANLFRQINTGGMGDRQVEFHISGTELVGVLNNNYRKQSLVR